MIRIDNPLTMADIIEDIEYYDVWNYLDKVGFRYNDFQKVLAVISENYGSIYVYSLRKRGKFFL